MTTTPPPASPDLCAADLAASGLVASDMDAVFTPFVYNQYKFPFYTPDGNPHPYITKTKNINPPPGTQKYVSPSLKEIEAAGGVPSDTGYPYLNPHGIRAVKGVGPTWEVLGKVPGKYFVIAEGEKKAVSSMKILGIPTVGFAGADMLTIHTELPGRGKIIHPVVDALIQPADIIDLVFDGDIETNPNVRRAAGTARRALMRLHRNIIVRFVILPAGMAGKVGLDDWLLSVPAANAPALFAALPRVSGEGFPEDNETMWAYLGLMVGSEGAPIKNEWNAFRILTHHDRYKGHIWFEVVEGVIWSDIGGGPARRITDEEIMEETRWMQRNMGLGAWPYAKVLGAFMSVRAVKSFHRNRVLEELGTEEWDGVARLETMFIKYFHADDNEYTRMVGRNWYTSALARLLQPGCKVDTMLILEGKQGIGKSTALSILGGCGYIGVELDFDHKDFKQTVHSGWMIDIPEIGSLTRKDMTSTKGFLSQCEDTFRAPYATIPKTLPRRFVLVGSTNQDDYLQDSTGNRRFWPIDCGGTFIDRKGLTAARPQLFAEARARVAAGLAWYEEVQSVLTVLQQTKRVAVDPWVEILEGQLADPKASGRHLVIPPASMMLSTFTVPFVMTGDLLHVLRTIGKRGSGNEWADVTDSRRLRKAMACVAGWVPHRLKNKVLVDLSGGVRSEPMGYIQINVTVPHSATVLAITTKPNKF